MPAARILAQNGRGQAVKFLLIFPPALPQSDDAEEQRKYRRAMHSWTARMSILAFAGALLAAAAMSPYGFARAGDVKAQIAEIKTIQDRDSKRLALSLSNGIASELRFLMAKRCKETNNSEERDRLIRESDRKQDEYKELRGEYYRVPRCEDL